MATRGSQRWARGARSDSSKRRRPGWRLRRPRRAPRPNKRRLPLSRISGTLGSHCGRARHFSSRRIEAIYAPPRRCARPAFRLRRNFSAFGPETRFAREARPIRRPCERWRLEGPDMHEIRAEQGQWSRRRRDARTTTKAGLRRRSGADPSVAAPRLNRSRWPRHRSPRRSGARPTDTCQCLHARGGGVPGSRTQFLPGPR